ncbi:MAG: HAMP domain-containing histidine kinase [Planctomycetes bacterium]|nr:HAMP domain-containing histidine kinase [Planctomycetota bacterium]
MTDDLRAVLLSDAYDAPALELEDGRVVAANQAARARLPAAAPGRALADALAPDAADRLQAALAAGAPTPWEASPGAPLLVLPLGPSRHLLLALTADAVATERLLALNTQLASLMGEQARLAAENARLLEEARRLASAREVLLAAVSHDLRSPLGTIVVSADLVRVRAAAASDAADVVRAAAAIQRAARRMSALVDDLLDAEQVESGRLTLRPATHPLRPILEEALEGARAAAETAQVRLEAAQVAPGVTARCDRERVLRVLGNLLANAIRFTPGGGSVTLAARRRGGEVVVDVTDTGRGVDPALRPRLFERGATTGDGHGLGLFICRAFVEAQGGGIGLEDAPGGGSRFWFTLPGA